MKEFNINLEVQTDKLDSIEEVIDEIRSLNDFFKIDFTVTHTYVFDWKTRKGKGTDL